MKLDIPANKQKIIGKKVQKGSSSHEHVHLLSKRGEEAEHRATEKEAQTKDSVLPNVLQE